MALPKPDYLSRDFQSLKASMLQYATSAFPDWRPSSDGDLGVVLVESMAYLGDILSYYTDRAQFESYLPTAKRRDSVLSLAYLLGYTPNSGSPATGTVGLVTGSGVAETVLPAGTQIASVRIPSIDGPAIFETNEEVILLADGAPNPPIAVTEGESVRFSKIGESTGFPNQIFLLPESGVYRETVRIFVEDDLGSNVFRDGTQEIRVREWLGRAHMLDSGPQESVFEVQANDRVSSVLFGDDVNGAIPATGLNIYASFRFGNGEQGNLPAGAVRLINDSLAGNVSVVRDGSGVYQSTEMTGGTDPESTDSIRYNAPRAYRIQNRIITEKDFVDAALGVQGVLKASMLAGTFTSVTVYVTGPDGLAPSTTLKNTVQKELLDRTLAGADVTVASPTFVPVNLGTEASPVFLRLSPQYSTRVVKAAARRVVQELFTKAAFGDPLSVGKFYEAFASIEGVLSIDIPVMARADSTQSGIVTMVPREWEMFTLGDFHLTTTGGVI